MAKLQVKVLDYFCKYGHRDGNNRQLTDKAERLRPRVVGWLNREFEQRGLAYRAEPVDVFTCHNSVRMCLRWPCEERSDQHKCWYEWEDFRTSKVDYDYTKMDQTGHYDLVIVGVAEGFPPDVEDVLTEVQKKLN